MSVRCLRQSRPNCCGLPCIALTYRNAGENLSTFFGPVIPHAFGCNRHPVKNTRRGGGENPSFSELLFRGVDQSGSHSPFHMTCLSFSEDGKILYPLSLDDASPSSYTIRALKGPIFFPFTSTPSFLLERRPIIPTPTLTCVIDSLPLPMLMTRTLG